MTALAVDSIAPDFELPDQDGNVIKLSEVAAQGPVVVYFYPKDDTPGCTKEACEFRDKFQEFKDLGATVIGVSSDNVEKHKKFEQKYNLTQRIVADADGKLRKEWGVPKALFFPGRVTYLIDQQMKVRFVLENNTNMQIHSTKMLEELKKLKEVVAA
ncbi:MAG: putative peroxiredoxin Q/BCP [Streblomastix strix]|uniref:thioredoxin-dependent peroxiredoxin n=1 Tax=Streblomastix strix TaxID=222440 RepID=A0A5J4WEY9_9EUKA|nr:MAG: putative peroxiredoxin Q/BCP [Streblomastix strix]